jgi:glyoxylate/hydroxypyruvate reductase A
MTPINLVFDSQTFDFSDWQAAFAKQSPFVHLYDANSDSLPDVVDFVLLWHPKQRDWSEWPSLKAAFALGAGLDHLSDLVLPDKVALHRLYDAGMKGAMCEYAHYAVLRYQRHFDTYERAQKQALWQPLSYRGRDSFTVGVLGLGGLGQAVASHLANSGYTVTGCSRNRKPLAGITCFTLQSELYQFLQGADLLINLLPKNDQTANLVDGAALAELPKNSAVINMSRGGIINESALLKLIDDGHIQWAMIDVFDKEPLPSTHPFWHHSNIKVTPHISAQTLAEPAVSELLERFSDFVSQLGLFLL